MQIRSRAIRSVEATPSRKRTSLTARNRRRVMQAEQLESRQMLAADVIITEFMADNAGTILDVDGDKSDWVELYNRGDTPQDMNGWYLTDNANSLKKWTFPAVIIDPGETILVWATSKNRVDPNGQLHTSWGLSKGGEFLGLVMPDGVTIKSQFAPTFPAQLTDVSYGIPTTQVVEALVTHSSATQVLIPTNGNHGTSWTTASFVPDAAWVNGVSQGVGYDTAPDYLPLIGTNVGAMRNVNSSAYIRIPFNATADDYNQLTMRIRYDDGFVAYLNGQEIARRNAPANVAWNSSAPADRIDSVAIGFETINLSAFANLINTGNNVLSIHALNVVPTSSDLLIDAELSAGRVEVLTAQPPRFFFTPSPGVPNVAGTLDTRPIVIDVTNTAVSDAADVTVTGRVVSSGAPVSRVELRYRVMYGAEILVTMLDDGLHGDGAAGDGVFGGVIPASASGPGQMVRYYVSATSTNNAIGRAPLFSNPNATSEYYGFVIADPTITSALPVFQIFTQNPNWFRNSNGTMNRNIVSGSFYYNGQFYDNIQLNIRGDTSVTNAYPIQKLKIEFNDDHRFDFGDGRPDTGSINLDNVYLDPSYARLTLGAEVFRAAGAYAQLVEPVHARMNGQFYSLGIYSERANGAFLERNGLDKEGALYESEGIRDSQGYLSPNAGNLGTIAGMQKDNREWDPSFADLQALINGISPSNPNRDQYIFDNVNIPNVVNVLATYSLVKQYDKDAHNFYVYRDSDGTGEWSLIPWDLDLIWDRLIEPLYDRDYFSGSPFEGSSQDPTWAGTHWNRLIDAFADSPILSQMLVRRLRTLMDEILQPPGTPYADRILEANLDALFTKVMPDAALDLAKWGTRTGGSLGGPWPLGSGVTQLKAAFDLRRNYLYGLSYVPAAQSATPNITIVQVDAAPQSGNQDQEFIQLFNPNAFAVDVSDWTLSDAVTYTIAKGVVIPAGGSLFVVKDVVAFRARQIGPRAGQGLFIQGGYSGNLSSAGETVVLTRANGSTAASLTYGPITEPPVLGSIPNQILSSGAISAPIALPASDPDTPTANLTFTANTQSPLYLLDQQLNLSAPTITNYPYQYYANIRGASEKYLINPTGVNPVNQWYYLLPNGNLYLFTGNPANYGSPATLTGTFVANVGVAVYQNPALLHNAQPANIPVTFSFTTGDTPTLQITPGANYTGAFVVTVTVSDGGKTDSESFQVQVYEPTTAPPVIAAIPNQVLTSGVSSAPIPLSINDADTSTADLIISATVQSSLYLLDQRLKLNAPTINNYPYAYYANIRNSSEKYLINPSGTNPINQWYYILPGGNLYLFTGNPAAYGSPGTLSGTFITNVGNDVYLNPALLHNAQPATVPVSLQVNPGASPTLIITPSASFEGSFVVTVTASDGKKVDTESFQVQVNIPTTAPPVLGAFANQVLTSGVPSAPITINVTDADTATADLTFTATAQSSLYLLDQQLNLSAPTVSSYPYAYYANIRGVGEKYLYNPAGVNPINQWYYILPSGGLYLFTGNPASYGSPGTLSGKFLTNVGTDVYQNPALLHAALPSNPPVTLQVTPGATPTLVVTPAAAFTGTFLITVTASDGTKTDAESFQVQVNEPTTAAPILGPIAKQRITAGVTAGAIALDVTDADTNTADLTFAGTAVSPLFLLDQQLNLTAPTVNNYPYAYYANIRGMSEKYLYNPAGVNPINQWYYILPNGNLYLFTGNPAVYGSPASLKGALIANVGAAVYNNPALLHNAQPVTIPVTFDFTTGSTPTLTMTANASFAGTFVAVVTVSDGTKTSSQSFEVQVDQGQGEAAFFDTDASGEVTPLDALLVVNALNAGIGLGEQSQRSGDWQLLDTNRDGVITPLDALLVINYLNSGPLETTEVAFGGSVESFLDEVRSVALAAAALEGTIEESATMEVLLDDTVRTKAEDEAASDRLAVVQALAFWYSDGKDSSRDSRREEWIDDELLDELLVE